MFVRTLELRNFRNYNTLSINFSDGINILYGDNAQGKTNILEALYLSATTKSQKGSKEKDIIQFEQDESHIRILVQRNNRMCKIDVHLKKNKPKGVAIDGIPIKKSSELFGLIHMISFSPEDLYLIKDGPGERRRFLDMELCQLDKIYLFHLTNYNKIINQRNNLLKQIGFKRELLETIQIWDDQLANYGNKIMKARRKFIKQLNEIIKPIHKKLSGDKEELVISYVPNVEEDKFYDKLRQSIDRDIALKMTNTGPHRDDIVFIIDNIEVRKFGSQGQQRTAALSLKLAEIELVKKIIKDCPVLLLDDVLSELDKNRQKQLLDSIHGVQTIITCTGIEEFIMERVKTDKIYQVIEGTIKERII